MTREIFLCPNCNNNSTFQVESRVLLEKQGTYPNLIYLTLRCDVCEKVTFKIEENDCISMGDYTPHKFSEKDFFQYPYGFINTEPTLPNNIAGYYSEAFNSYVTGQLRAAAAMCRATISAICDDKKVAKGELKERINRLPLSIRLSLVAKNIKWIGDKTLHNKIDWAMENWKPEIIKEMLDFIERIIDDLYTQERKSKELNNKITTEAKKEKIS